ncbi:MAG: type III PLP-dependent enzyme [Planctomycetaceae bacterium]
MDDRIRTTLDRIGARQGTPCYVYFLDEILSRAALLQRTFQNRFTISYAVKANPNVEFLRQLRGAVGALDVSSGQELDRALAAGFESTQISFSGPGKRRAELEHAVRLDCGEIVCESREEIQALNEIAAKLERRPRFLIRINPLRMPRRFGVNMAGSPSQFGIDEECLDLVLQQRHEWKNLDWRGFHIYSGTNCLDAEAVAENFGIFIDLFRHFAATYELEPRRLIFGAGFGIPYLPKDRPLDLQRVAELTIRQIDDLHEVPRMERAECVLELGRWLVGPAGYLVTSVIGRKQSRGSEIAICDAGFNNHLAACGMMGTVIRRNWQIEALDGAGDSAGDLCKYHLVGPLCTTIDQLATDIMLPRLRVGARIAILNSGAYGLTASPIRFISHPEPREYLVMRADHPDEILDITESIPRL